MLAALGANRGRCSSVRSARSIVQAGWGCDPSAGVADRRQVHTSVPVTPVKPRRLREGDLVSVVSPSSALAAGSEPRLCAGVAALEGLGLRVEVPEHVFARDAYSAGTAQARADTLTETWRDPRVRMIVMSQGGQTANGVLDKLDYELFGRHPKIFMGLSDGTTLLHALSARAGIVTFHGPDLLFGLGRPLRADVVDQLRCALRRRAAFAADQWHARPATGAGEPIARGRAPEHPPGDHARGYGPSFEGRLLFLEGTNPIDELDRQLTVLRLHGVFDQISGLVLRHFDRPSLPDPSADIPVAELALSVCSAYDFPIVEIEYVGHRVDNIVLPTGVRASVDTFSGTFELDEPVVE